MKVTVRQDTERHLVLVYLAGELDIFTAGQVRTALSELIDRGHLALTVDLRYLAFMDSTGLAVLIGALKKVRAQNGSLNLICADGQPARILKQTGLNKVFNVYPTPGTVRFPV